MPKPTSLTCPRCATPGSATGLCPACLLEGVLAGPEWTGPDPGDPASFPPPRCGPWQLLEVIGRGGTGVVYRARQEGLSRPVAVKILSHTAGPEEWRRFRTEAEAVTSLEHPHIIPVHASGETDGRPWLVMKLAEQGALTDRLRDFPHGLEPREAARLVEQIARAVQFAHERGVLHRDLKPANILLDGDGSPMVSDFGLARLLHGPGTGTLTGFAVGTPAYMPPEQAGGDTITTVSDVYSLGAILYHLLTGRPPFTGTMALTVMRDVMTMEPPAPRTVRPALDRDLSVICQKAIEKTPGRRYASATALADDLARWQRGESVLARPAGLRERVWKWARRHPAKAAVSVLGILGAIAFVTLLSISRSLLAQERNEVKRQETEARAQARRAEATGEALRLQAYAGDIALARRALEEGNLGAARRLLDRWQPGPDNPDVRGFEWHALHHECQGDELAVLRHHTAPVLSLGWSPDGKYLATGGRDGKLVITRGHDGAMVRTLPDAAPGGSLTEIAWLARLPLHAPETAALLATGSLTPAEVLMRSRPSSIGEVTTLAWSPDGKWLASGSTGAFVRIWQTGDWTIHGFLPLKAVTQVAFSPDGRKLITAATGKDGSRRSGEIRLYHFPSMERILTLPDKSAFFAVPPSQPLLAVAAPGGEIQLFDLAADPPGPAPTARWNSAVTPVQDLAFSADGSRLALVHPHGLCTADAATGEDRHFLSAAPGVLGCVAASPGLPRFASGGTDQSVTLFDDPAGTAQPARRGHDDEVRALAFSPDGQRLASAGNDHTVRLWDAAGPPRRTPESVAESAALAAVSPDGSWQLGETPDGRVLCRKWPQPDPPATPAGVVRKALAFSSGDGFHATLQPDTGVVEWWQGDGTAAAPPLILTEEALPIKAFTVCPERGWLITGSDRHPISVRDWRTGTIRHRLPPPGPISRLVISPDGSQLGVLTWPRTLHLADPAAGTWRPGWRLGTGTVGPIQFSPDSRLLASGGDDNLVTVREVATGEVMATLKSHLATLTGLAFSMDGRTLASSAKDGTLRLWHVPTWRELGTLLHSPSAHNFVFTPHGLLVEEYRERWLLLPAAK